MSESAVKKKHYDYFDFLKAIAIYLVVISHFNNMHFDLINENGFIVHLNYFLRSIFAVSVPMFLFINGALLITKTDLGLKKHIIKTLKIFWVFLVWGFITIIALLYIRNENWSISEILKAVWNIEKGWINHLWFLEALIIIYIFFPFLYSSFKNHLSSFYFFLVCVLVFTFGNTLVNDFLNVISFFTSEYKDLYFEINLYKGLNPFKGIYGYTIGYFMLGGVLFYYRDYLLDKKIFRLLSLILIPVSMMVLYLYGYMVSVKTNETWNSVWYGKDFIFTLINVAAIFTLSLKYTHKGIIGKGIKVIGENSLGIYLIHVIIGEIFYPHFIKMDLSANILVNLLFVFVILIISLLVALVMKKIPYVRSLLLA